MEVKTVAFFVDQGFKQSIIEIERRLRDPQFMNSVKAGQRSGLQVALSCPRGCAEDHEHAFFVLDLSMRMFGPEHPDYKRAVRAIQNGEDFKD